MSPLNYKYQAYSATYTVREYLIHINTQLHVVLTTVLITVLLVLNVENI